MTNDKPASLKGVFDLHFVYHISFFKIISSTRVPSKQGNTPCFIEHI